MTTDHAARIEIVEGGYTATLICNAPPHSICRAEYSCDCEQYYDEEIRNGVPAHMPDPDDADCWHAGEFGAPCRYQAWFDSHDEVLAGAVTAPIKPVWEGDWYSFEIVTPPDPPTPTYLEN